MAPVTEFGILKAGKHVNLRDLHVESRERYRRMNKASIGLGLGPLMIYSGARTYALQKRLFDDYEARNWGPPIVADPDRGYGSKHQVRPVKFKLGNLPNPIPAAYAMDIKLANGSHPNLKGRVVLREAGRLAGLNRSVASEWWHFEPFPNLQVHSICGLGWYGDQIRQLQTTLNRVANANLVVDGMFGPKLYAAVAAFQQSQKIDVTGDWTHVDHARALALLNKPSSRPPAIDGFTENPTEAQTLREIRKRARAARDLLTPQHDAYVLVDEIARLVYHEQND